MGFLKKYAQVIAPLFLIVLYFITRLTNILALPIFTDEAIYTRWAQIAKNDAAWLFISLTDGKQPLFIWMAILFMPFTKDPLLAGRLVSVFAGLSTVVGLYFLTTELFNNKKMALLASLFYIFYPFALVYDRIALYDSLVATFAVWSLYIEILLVKRLKFILAVVLGVVIGLGMLTKTSADFFLVLLPASLLLFPFKDKMQNKKFRKWVVFAGVAVVLANLLYFLLRLSPLYYIINQKNAVFIYPFKEWIQHPFTYLFSNLSGLTSWLLGYMTIPFLLLVLTAFLFKQKFLREKILLLLWFIVPFFALAVFGKLIYPRFILFMTIPLLVLATFALYQLLQAARYKVLQVLVFLVFTILFFKTDYFILTNFSKAPIPQTDKEQFLTDWPSGVGVKETVSFLEKKAKEGKIYVGTEGTFGLMPYSLEIYLHDNKNIKIASFFWEISDYPPKEVIEVSKKMPTYFVFYEPCSVCKVTGKAPPLWPVKTIFQIQKEKKDTFYTLYQIGSK